MKKIFNASSATREGFVLEGDVEVNRCPSCDYFRVEVILVKRDNDLWLYDLFYAERTIYFD